jgi:predicted phosphoribosyltransferase
LEPSCFSFEHPLEIARHRVIQLMHAKFYSRSHDAVIRVYDGAGNMIETHESAGANSRAITRKHPERPVIAQSVAKPSAFGPLSRILVCRYI